MKSILILLFALGTSGIIHAQDDSIIYMDNPSKGAVYTIKEEIASFKYKDCSSTEDCFLNYVHDSIRYNGIQCSGELYVQFFIQTDGSIKYVKVVKGIEGCDDASKEVIRLVSSMPNWRPGKQNGKAINTPFVMKIDFNPNN